MNYSWDERTMLWCHSARQFDWITVPERATTHAHTCFSTDVNKSQTCRHRAHALAFVFLTIRDTDSHQNAVWGCIFRTFCCCFSWIAVFTRTAPVTRQFELTSISKYSQFDIWPMWNIHVASCAKIGRSQWQNIHASMIGKGKSYVP